MEIILGRPIKEILENYLMIALAINLAASAIISIASFIETWS